MALTLKSSKKMFKFIAENTKRVISDDFTKSLILVAKYQIFKIKFYYIREP